MTAGGPVVRVSLLGRRVRPIRERNRRLEARRRRERVAALWAELLALLTPPGQVPHCAHERCRTRKRLQVDHVDGRDWDPARLNQETRLKRYLAEYRAGVRLRLLCIKHNGLDGRMRQREREPGEEG